MNTVMPNEAELETVRRLDGERYLCAMFASPDRRTALLALLAFNLELARIPELVSEALLGQMRLQWWRQSIDGIYQGQVPDHPIGRMLADAVTEHSLDKGLFDEILDAREGDLTEVAFEDIHGLESYAEATGGALNQLMAKVLSLDRQHVDTLVRPIGTAWALTGLLRAMPFHQAQGRRYITMLPQQVAATAAGLIADARSRAGKTERKMMPVLLPAVLGEYYLRRLAQSGYDAAHTRVQVAGPGRLLKVYLAYLRRRF
ncbi:MAG: squalene/phytoene synthase family protein [Rhodospirillaceae bacterium]|nr:squalene/phytoene synthase family protein [Rhodospirillaceae bacterium]MBT4219796.1 squalene/phytoene synthase family protein [Rhodospirillaceae bacterium]MBT7356237.1 squalene/phytoene synthase family protein [Rhodospirillaceae bacterium]